jgi:hypothetical protein
VLERRIQCAAQLGQRAAARGGRRERAIDRAAKRRWKVAPDASQRLDRRTQAQRGRGDRLAA